MAAALEAAGVEVRRSPEAVPLRGSRRVAGARLSGGETWACDTVVFAGPRAPASELARQAGAAVAPEPLSGGWRVLADAQGATTAPGLWAAGEVTGPMSAAAAAEAGRRAGGAVDGG